MRPRALQRSRHASALQSYVRKPLFSIYSNGSARDEHSAARERRSQRLGSNVTRDHSWVRPTFDCTIFNAMGTNHLEAKRA